MSEQPEALRLADHLMGCFGIFITSDEFKAATELRRLHEQLERKSDAIQRLWKERDGLRKNNAELLAALKQIDEQTVEGGRINTLARAAIAKAEGTICLP